MRNNYVFEFLVDFDNLKFHLLSNINVEITDRLDVYLRSRQESLDSKHINNQAAFRTALDLTLNDEISFLGFIDFVPSTEDAGSSVRYHQLAIFIFLALNKDGNNVSDLEFWVVSKFAGTNDALGFVTNIYDYFLFRNAHDSTVNYLFLFNEG